MVVIAQVGVDALAKTVLLLAPATLTRERRTAHFRNGYDEREA